MQDFAAMILERLANDEQHQPSVRVGAAVVRGGEIADTFYSLIQPEPNYYNYWCHAVHYVVGA